MTAVPVYTNFFHTFLLDIMLLHHGTTVLSIFSIYEIRDTSLLAARSRLIRALPQRVWVGKPSAHLVGALNEAFDIISRVWPQPHFH